MRALYKWTCAASTGQLKTLAQRQVRRPHAVMKDGVEGDGGV